MTWTKPANWNIDWTITLNGNGWSNVVDNNKNVYFLVRNIDMDEIDRDTPVKKEIDHILFGNSDGLTALSIINYWATTNSTLHISYEDGRLYTIYQRKHRERLLGTYDIQKMYSNSLHDMLHDIKAVR